MALASNSGCGSYGDASGPLSATRSETCINGSPQPIRRRTLAALLLIPSQGRATRPLPLRWPKGNGRRRRVGKIGSLLARLTHGDHCAKYRFRAFYSGAPPILGAPSNLGLLSSAKSLRLRARNGNDALRHRASRKPGRRVSSNTPGATSGGRPDLTERMARISSYLATTGKSDRPASAMA